jgi:hypothetical protein
MKKQAKKGVNITRCSGCDLATIIGVVCADHEKESLRRIASRKGLKLEIIKNPVFMIFRG